MSEPAPAHEPLEALIDDYLNGQLDDARLRELEGRLRDDPDARRLFVRYARLHTDLHHELRARQASERVLDVIDREGGRTPAPSRRHFPARLLAAAAALVLGLGLGWWLTRDRPPESPGDAAVAWLVNAQNCTWADGEPAGSLQPGKTLQVTRGLAEIHFQCGARVVIEGPASLELVSGHSARLRHGKLTARAPAASGFEVLSPAGKVVDLGTEFGVSVAPGGATDVYVFQGKVEAHPGGPGARAGGVSLTQNQSARIDAGQVTLRPNGPGADRFVRAIVPAPVVVPHPTKLTFDSAAAGGVRDADGAGTGLTHRLPGTGDQLPPNDPNLRLDPAKGHLELTTTNNDINGQTWLGTGEYLGVRLSDLGFTGKEDFAATLVVANIPALEVYGQFGLYAGTASDRVIRGGLISGRRREPGQNTQFLVNNDGGRDTDLYRVGLLSPGTDLRLTLKRTGGKYSLTVENLTEGGASTLTIRHPEFLDNEPDLYVGLFGANTASQVRKTLIIKEFSATVWAVAPAAAPAE